MLRGAAGKSTTRRRAATAAVLLALVTGCSSAGSEVAGPASPTPSQSGSATASPSGSPATPEPTPSTSAGNSSASPSAAPSAAGSAPASAAPRPELAPFYGQALRWTPCRESFECTRVRVPLDYDRPDADAIALSVVRLKATGPDRLGSLLLNPGGPGGSGVEYARSASAVVSDEVRASYDVVGFDPRGVATSAPVDCLTDPQTDRFIAADGSPDSPAEEQELITTADLLAKGCASRSGRLLPHVGTQDAARDLDVLRAVLGDTRLNYLGKSYGTYLGATYADLFPARVGAVVLDGALDPKATSSDVSLEQAKGFETALGAFVDDCLRQSDCPLTGPRAAGVRQVGQVLDRVDRSPLPTSQRRTVSQALAILGVATALYDEGSGWPLLRQGLQEALDGTGDTLLLLADVYTERQEDGTYSSNSNEVIYAVNCLDRQQPYDLAQVRATADRFAREAPIFGRYLAWSDVPCGRWPVPAANTPHPVTAPGAGPILVVGTTRDPATPFKWSVSLAEQLESGVLLEWNGDGHTAYRRGSTCIDGTVDAYLLRGEVPPDGKRCE